MEKSKVMRAAVIALGIVSSSASAMETQSVIDMHCHVAGLGATGSGCFVADGLRKSWRYRIFLKSFGVTEKELLREGDGVIVKRLSETLANSQTVSYAVVLAMDGVVDKRGELDRKRTEVYIPNEFVADEVKKYPNLLFGASINPYRKDAIERLARAAEAGAVLVKWLPPIQNIDPSDERLIPFYEKLKDLNMPLLTHTGKERTFTWSRDALGDPERLRLPLSLGVTVIAAHSACNGYSGGKVNYDRFLRLCREYTALHADVSSLTQVNRLGRLEQVLRQPELRGRLLYGTDMPLINTAIVSPFAFPFRLSLRQMIRISRMQNPWDRDVALKKALGMPDQILTKATSCLKLDNPLKRPGNTATAKSI